MRRSTSFLTGCAAVIGCSAVIGFGQQPGSIRDIDFRNFQYTATPCAEEGKGIEVRNGEYTRTEADDKAFFKVLKVVYGDLNDDGADEAVVLSLCNTGGTGQFTDGHVFSLRGGAPVLLTTLGVGDRADEGIHGVTIDRGRLRVDRYGHGEGGGACCPEFVVSTLLKWNGKAFEEVAALQRRTYYDALNTNERPPYRLRFLRGTSGIVLVGLTTGGDAYVLGARKDQTLKLVFETEDPTSEVVVVGPGNKRVGSVSGTGNAALVLPATGDYTLRVQSRAAKDAAGATYSVDVVIE